MTLPGKIWVGEAIFPPSSRFQTTVYSWIWTSRNCSDVAAGVLRRLVRMVVWNWTAAFEFTCAPRGRSWKLPKRNTGVALSHWVFVEQPGSAYRASATTAVERMREAFFIVRSSANDPRRDEDHQLVRALGLRTAPE